MKGETIEEKLTANEFPRNQGKNGGKKKSAKENQSEEKAAGCGNGRKG